MKFDVEAIFFDFGATLFDYYPPNQVIWSRIAKRLGRDISPDDPRIWEGMKNQFIAFTERVKTFSKLTEEELFSLNRKVLETMGINYDGTVDIIWEEFERRRDGYKIFPECKFTLKEIKKKGIKIGLLSNCDEQHGRTRRPTMEENGILHYFDTIILSSEVRFEKPERKIFEIALNTIGVEDSSKAVHIGNDPISDVKGAANAGLIPVLFTGSKSDDEAWYSEDVLRINKLSEILKHII